VANVNAPFGFRHTSYQPGGAPDYQLSSYAIATSYATQIGFGDPVCINAATAANPFLIQATGALATTQPIVGIFQGCLYIPSAGGAPVYSPFFPGSVGGAAATAYVIDSPIAQFFVQTLNTAVTSAMIGQVVNFTTGQCSTVGGGFSVATIDQSTATSSGTTASFLPFRITGLYPGVGNGSDPTTAYNVARVCFNYQIFRGTTSGA
jgi:hypothetical protein